MADQAVAARLRATAREAHDAFLALEQATIYAEQGSTEAQRRYLRIGHTHLLRASSLVNMIQTTGMEKMSDVREEG